MSAQIIKFPVTPRNTIRICRVRNGAVEYRTIIGTRNDCPAGWSLSCTFVSLHKGGAA